MGYEVVRTGRHPRDLLAEKTEFLDIYERCKDYTMTSVERMYALYKSVEYIIKNEIPGDFIECGVWRGGSSMIIAQTLIKFHATNRRLVLFDTFEGMSAPTEKTKTAKVLLQKNCCERVIQPI